MPSPTRYPNVPVFNNSIHQACINELLAKQVWPSYTLQHVSPYCTCVRYIAARLSPMHSILVTVFWLVQGAFHYF
jgi:hypothetical protein